MTTSLDVHGLGMFLASRDMIATPRVIRRKLLDCAATWAPILVESLDGRRQPLDRIREHAIEMREHDIRPAAYSFPHPKRGLAGADYLNEACEVAKIDLPCLDIEPAADADWTERAIAETFAAVAARRAPTITLFTRPEWNHVAWNDVAPGVPIWLQVYERVAEAGRLAGAIGRWKGRAVVPLIGTYLGETARLERDLVNVADAARAAGSAGVWALATTDAEERAALRRFALGTWARRAA